MNVTGSCSTC